MASLLGLCDVGLWWVGCCVLSSHLTGRRSSFTEEPHTSALFLGSRNWTVHVVFRGSLLDVFSRTNLDNSHEMLLYPYNSFKFWSVFCSILGGSLFLTLRHLCRTSICGITMLSTSESVLDGQLLRHLWEFRDSPRMHAVLNLHDGSSLGA